MKGPRPKKGAPKVPASIPGVEDKNLQSVPSDKMPKAHLSPLGIYLKQAGLTVSAFAKAGGWAIATVQQWATGENVPNLPAAFELERVTKGVIPMESWLALPQAKAMFARWRASQVGDYRMSISPGGFAMTEEEIRKMRAESQKRATIRQFAVRDRQRQKLGEVLEKQAKAEFETEEEALNDESKLGAGSVDGEAPDGADEGSGADGSEDSDE